MKNSLKTEILRLKRQLFGGNMSQSNSNNLTLFDYADIISSSVTDLENKRRLFAELLNDTESEADKEYQNTVAEIKDVCAWLDKIISQFSNPDEGIVTVIRLVGVNADDLLYSMAGSFPTVNGNAAVAALKSVDSLDDVAEVDSVGSEFWDSKPLYWEVMLYDLRNKNNVNVFSKPFCTYLVTLEGIVIDCYDENGGQFFSFGSNFCE